MIQACSRSVFINSTTSLNGTYIKEEKTILSKRDTVQRPVILEGFHIHFSERRANPHSDVEPRMRVCFCKADVLL